MGFLQTLFGGSNQSGSSAAGPIGSQLAAFNQFFPMIQALQNQFQGDPSQLIAGFTPTQLQGQQSQINAAQGALPQIAQQAAQGFETGVGAATPGSEVFNQALQATLNPFIRNFQQNVIPGLRQQAVGVGQAGSSREGIAQGLAAQGLSQQLGDQSALFANQALSRLPSILGAGQGVANLQLAPGNVLGQVGGQQQAMNQQFALAPFNLAARLRQLLGGSINQSQGQSSAEKNPGLISLFPDNTSIFG